MERPITISPAAWSLLAEKIEENPGPYLLESGLLDHAGILRGITIEIPLADAVETCVIDSAAATAIAAGNEHIRMRRIGDGKEYLVPRQVLVDAFREGGEIDYIEKGVS